MSLLSSNGCWPDGVLRAHLDRELAPEEMDRVAAHLGGCPKCAQREAELGARAARVGAFLEALPVPQLEWTPPAPRRAATGRRWIGLAAGLAAALVLAALLVPRHKDLVKVAAPAHLVAEAPLEAPLESQAPAMVAPPVHTAAAPRRIRRSRLPVRAVSNEFLALDDEPIESGVVMRVGVEPGNVQADVLFGPDGRAHAIRLVNSRN